MSLTEAELLGQMRRLMVTALAMDEQGNEQGGYHEELYTNLITELEMDELRMTVYVLGAKFARFIRLAAIEDRMDPAEGIAKLFEQ